MMRKSAAASFKIHDSFWAPVRQLVREIVIPRQEQILNDDIPGVEKSHALENFRIAAGLSQGEFYGMVFQDSDVAKWLEAVSYSLSQSADAELERRADEVIGLIGAAQCPDGYLNTYFTVKHPERRWQNLRECHELYCAGHMMEAAVAYYEATGKRTLLDIMEKLALHIYDRFMGSGAVPGHQEVEIGLLRMYRATGNRKYLDLAGHFLNERGKSPNYFEREAKSIDWCHWSKETNHEYFQAHLPVREQTEAVGHSVRAVYMYTAMADLAAETGDDGLFEACRRLWDNIVTKRMYITGGIGSTVAGEAFTIDFDLPNDSMYTETCASIGFVFFASKMLELCPSNKYADVMERVIYNGVLSGMQADGKSFFYVNPLEVNPGISGVLHGFKHVLPERPDWFGCACCPPNIARFLLSLDRYAWGESEDTIYSHLFIGGTARFESGVELHVETNYPWEGTVRYTVNSGEKTEFTLALRVPAWEKSVGIRINGAVYEREGSMKDGYCHIRRRWKTGDCVEMSLGLSVRRIYANPLVRADAGCTALMRGPVVYCFEGVDHNAPLQALRIPAAAPVKAESNDDGIVTLSFEGVSLRGCEELYSDVPPMAEKCCMTAIPYYAWGNRGRTQMRVWMPEF